jgi:hypothetical protein
LNALRKKVTRLSGFALVTTGLVLGQLGFATTANAVELIQDGGFEAGASGDSPAWIEADTEFGTPLCTAAACGTGGGTAGPHGGTVWAWFGGSATTGHTGSVSQAVTIPTGDPATLTYWYWNGSVNTPFDATLTVKIDATTVKTHTEASTAEPGYTQQTVDISAFADGGSHTLSFNYLNGGTGITNMSVDDVSINAGPPPDTTPPDTTITSSPAGGIAKSLTVPISFTSTETPSTFTCTLDSGASAPCTSPRSLTVTPGQHTFKVAATDAAMNTDATPATVTFTAYDCTTLNAAVTAAQAKADAAAKKLAKAKKALKKAKKSGNASKVKKAKKKLKKAKKAAKAAKAEVAVATSAAAPCGGSPRVAASTVDTSRR